MSYAVMLLLLAGEPPAGPFAIASGAEWSGEHARLFPLLRDAGVGAVRLFPEWAGIQPERDEWRYEAADALLASARENGLEILGLLHYLAPWVSSAPPTADHGARTRTFPLTDRAAWREFVRRTCERYRGSVRYWEVYNEFNSPAFARDASIDDYVALVRDAYAEAKQVDPGIQIGIGCADVDLSFLGRVIEAGAGGCFDVVSVHPYSLLDAALDGRETVFLRLGDNLRTLLARTGQEGVALWISEIGRAAPAAPAAEQAQAEALVKAYAMSLAQGIERICWFEGRGPAYGDGGSFGIVRDDWTLRPAHAALRTMTRLFGRAPAYVGWHNPAGNSFGFLFDGAAGPVLVAWAAGDAADRWEFAAPVTVTSVAGTEQTVRAVRLDRAPVLIGDLPAALVAEIRARGAAPFPWLLDYSAAEAVTCTMGAANVESGLVQIDRGDGVSMLGLLDGVHARRTDRERGMFYLYFDVDDSFAALGDTTLAITVVARRTDPAVASGLNLVYESETGYRNLGEWWTVPAEPGWHTHTFRVTDANFANNWGWNFRFEAVHSPGDSWVREVRVAK